MRDTARLLRTSATSILDYSISRTEYARSHSLTAADERHWASSDTWDIVNSYRNYSPINHITSPNKWCSRDQICFSATCREALELARNAMTEPSPRKDVLYDILRVLERIEARLECQEDRVRQLEDTSNARVEKDRPEADVKSRDDTKYLDAAGRLDKEDPQRAKSLHKIPYGEWSVDQFIRSLPGDPYNEWDSSHTHLDRFFNLELSKPLQQRLGDCWGMPDDGRLPLKYFKSNVLKTHNFRGAPMSESFSKAKQLVERELEFLCQFDENLRKHPGNDFVVVDFDATNNSRTYRLGNEAIGPELLVDSSELLDAPWSRVILYQGATTGDSIETEKRRREHPIPYFTRTGKLVGVWDHLSCHFQLKTRGNTTNPYQSRWTGFHTTFYEIQERTESQGKELWKHGPLYDHPLGWYFRKCAYTIYTPVSSDITGSVNSDPFSIARHWTILILAPSHFFAEQSSFFPSQTSESGQAQVSGDSFGRLSQPGAELKFIGQGMEKISERWAGFQAYFDYILDGGDSLMEPAEHDNLLFDDNTFSRSRKYFWVIDCLAEFDASITDNITQWELYKAARVAPILDHLSELDKRQYSLAERQYYILQNQRESFRQKLAATKALRDALFNASAVIESRASTRLTQNVKLLTFVSIFFLPLAFTTSLWSINDNFSRTALIYVIIIVASVTYMTMFNINSLAQGFGRVYDIRKKQIIRAMKSDRNETWKRRGQRFEVFRPKYDNPEPSEWYIPLYAAMHPAAALGLSTRRTRRASGRVEGSGGFFRRRQSKPKEVEQPDEAWVL